MLKLAQFLSNFNIFLLPGITLGSFRAARRRGDGSLLGDAIQSATGVNSNAIFIPIDADSGQINNLLKRHGIDTWGWGNYGRQLYFHVRHDDHVRAYTVLSAAGVELQ